MFVVAVDEWLTLPSGKVDAPCWLWRLPHHTGCDTCLAVVCIIFGFQIIFSIDAATKQASDLIHVATQSLNDVSSNHTCTAESLVYFVTRTYGSLERVDQQISNYKQTQGLSS